MRPWTHRVTSEAPGGRGSAPEKPRILIVDDNADSLQRYAQIFEKAGFDVIRGHFGATTSDEGNVAFPNVSAVTRYALNRENRIQAILTDLEHYNETTGHQEWFGEQVLRILNSQFHGLIFVHSGGLTEEKKQQLLDGGANAAFAKPGTVAGWPPIVAEIRRQVGLSEPSKTL